MIRTKRKYSSRKPNQRERSFGSWLLQGEYFPFVWDEDRDPVWERFSTFGEQPLLKQTGENREPWSCSSFLFVCFLISNHRGINCPILFAFTSSPRMKIFFIPLRFLVQEMKNFKALLSVATDVTNTPSGLLKRKGEIVSINGAKENG